MNRFIPLLFISLTIWIIGGSWMYTTYCCGTPTNDLTQVSSSSTASAIVNNQGFFQVEDGNAFEASCPVDLQFDYSGTTFQQNESQEHLQVFSKIKQYLEEHPKRVLHITGHYQKAESNSTLLPNLGIARACKLKDVFVTQGISPTQILMQSEMEESLTSKGGMLEGAAQLSFVTKEKVQEELNRIRQVLEAGPLLFYFENKADHLVLDVANRQYVFDLLYYLDQKPTAGLTCIGHTDNVGRSSKNNELGLDRANFVFQQLVNCGIAGQRIKVSSEGPNQPIADNDSSSGRAKNRRVEVKVIDSFF